MNELFDSKEIADLNSQFVMYIQEKRMESSNKQYLATIKDYLTFQVLNRIPKGSYEEIFSVNNIVDFQKNVRKGSILKASLNHLKKFLISKKMLPKGYEYTFVTTERPSINSIDFLDIDSIKNLFTDDITYRNVTEKLITKCLIALSFFCFFDQKHLLDLKISDIILEEKLVKNKRVNAQNPYLLKWIQVNDTCYNCLADYYYNYRQNLAIDSDLFFINPDNTEFKHNNDINYYFGNFNIVENKKLVKGVSARLLNASMMLYLLISSRGNALNTILEIVETKNVQWEKALIYYNTNYIHLSNPREIAELYDFNSFLCNYDSVVLENNNEDINNEDLDIELENEEILIGNNEIDLFMQKNKYNEKGDINLEDVLSFDSINNNNQLNKEVTIERLVRDTSIAKKLKSLYKNKCQLCGYQLRGLNGDYISEAHHIKPYNKIHMGDDTPQNMIVLCPNCHAQFDYLIYAINPETMQVNCLYNDDQYHLSELEFINNHELNKEYLKYVWDLFLEKKNMIK